METQHDLSSSFGSRMEPSPHRNSGMEDFNATSGIPNQELSMNFFLSQALVRFQTGMFRTSKIRRNRSEGPQPAITQRGLFCYSAELRARYEQGGDPAALQRQSLSYTKTDLSKDDTVARSVQGTARP